MDNRWAVPYNPYLTKKYKAHINVEVCTGVEAVKYINKYVYKGSDRTTLEIEDTQNEIKKYLHSRYIGPSEAMWNLFQFKTHEEDPTVISLQVHLPGQ
jgi:threonine aldolase